MKSNNQSDRGVPLFSKLSIEAAPGVKFIYRGGFIEASAPLLQELYDESFECDDAVDFILGLRKKLEREGFERR